jgi:CBS-domain-containing membrane protein
MPALAVRVAVVRAILRLESWTCHSPTKCAFAVAAVVDVPLVLEEFFEHPLTAIATTIVTAQTRVDAFMR